MSVMAIGYFTVWLAAGAAIYLLGVVFSAAVTHWTTFSRIVPALSDLQLLGRAGRLGQKIIGGGGVALRAPCKHAFSP